LTPLDSFLDIMSYEELSEVTIGAAKPGKSNDDNQAGEYADEDNSGGSGRTERTGRTGRGTSQRSTSSRPEQGSERGGYQSRGGAPSRNEDEEEHGEPEEREERSTSGRRVSNGRSQLPQRSGRGGQLGQRPTNQPAYDDDDDVPF
jgi:hypothetical protein